jgi:hypothetical protein
VSERSIGRLLGACLLTIALTCGAGCSAQYSAEPAPLPELTISATAGAAANATPTAATTPSAADEVAVTRAFGEYRAALLARDGKKAASLLSTDSVAYYAKLRALARTAPEGDLRAAPLFDQLAVLVLRATLPAKTIRSASATEIVVQAVEIGLIGEAAVRSLSVGTVKVSGEVATAMMVKNGEEGPLAMVFHREGARWKLNLLPLLESGETALQQAALQQGLTTARFVNQTLESQLGPARAAEAWRPIG